MSELNNAAGMQLQNNISAQMLSFRLHETCKNTFQPLKFYLFKSLRKESILVGGNISGMNFFLLHYLCSNTRKHLTQQDGT